MFQCYEILGYVERKQWYVGRYDGNRSKSASTIIIVMFNLTHGFAVFFCIVYLLFFAMVYVWFVFDKGIVDIIEGNIENVFAHYE